MMSTTHAAMGLSGACLLVPIAPEFATVGGAAAILGGVFPDLDVAFEHRKTLHHPELYPVAVLLAGAIALLRPEPLTVGAAVFLASAALHSLVDVFGGGLGLRPWKNDDARGIYLHLSGRWIPPKRWVRYDGAPEDLLVVVAFSIPPYLLFDGPIRTTVLLGVLASVGYVAIRKRMIDVFEPYLR